VALAFALGLAFASAFRLPTRVRRRCGQSFRTRAGPCAGKGGRRSGRSIRLGRRACEAGGSLHQVGTSRACLQPACAEFRRLLQRPAPSPGRAGSGSGFIVSQDGYILTNNHVVQGADRVTVRLLDNRSSPPRQLHGSEHGHRSHQIQTTGLPTVRLGDADSTKIGNWVLAIGNPLVRPSPSR